MLMAARDECPWQLVQAAHGDSLRNACDCDNARGYHMALFHIPGDCRNHRHHVTTLLRPSASTPVVPRSAYAVVGSHRIPQIMGRAPGYVVVMSGVSQ